MASESKNQEPFVSISFLKKRPDMTLEQFYHHWQHVHGPLVKPWMEKHGFLSYTQVHATQELKQSAKPIGPESSSNVLLEYDGAAIIQIPSFSVFETAFQDEYYKTVIAEDELRFLDKEAGVVRTRGEAKHIVKVL
ncbi:uncharacterized protein J7T54_005772 [Emericellopsis cladophorae]|uniref:EthD domain-containing protein n=1 Tax=Emericellopsis cladophorae TaxID=2686198 RepID=A0A9P9XXP1_9HYPO|nr:uncharacterized protein J7T54_005772 [Emericellopsis cladophorae]KAI6779742.1 hypothetical protein J7T54_005772 [Emericellopsis cladophorae]